MPCYSRCNRVSVLELNDLLACITSDKHGEHPLSQLNCRHAVDFPDFGRALLHPLLDAAIWLTRHLAVLFFCQLPVYFLIDQTLIFAVVTLPQKLVSVLGYIAEFAKRVRRAGLRL